MSDDEKHQTSSRRSSLFGDLFSRRKSNPKNSIILKSPDAKDETKSLTDDYGKRKSLQQTPAGVVLFNRQQRFSKRSQSICVDTVLKCQPMREKEKYQEVETDNNVIDLEWQIMRAKREARTISVIDGNLYIDYRYVAPVPIGLKI